MAFDYSSSFAGINNALGNIGKQNEIAYKRQSLANLGQQALGGDYNAAAAAAFNAGDADVGLGLLKLGQTQKQEADWLKANAGIFGGGVPAVASPGSTAPVAGPASLIQNESGGNWKAQNDAVGSGGAVGHFGRLQFGQARIQDAINSGALPPGTTPQSFMASPELQKRAEAWHFSDIDQKIQQNGFDKLIGQSINGVPITVDGLRAVAHLGGTEGMKKFVESGGRYNPADRNGTRLSDYFARHGGGGSVAQPQPVQAAQTAAPGDDPAKLRADAAYYEQANPEAARQMRARADAAEQGRGVQVAQAPAPAGVPASDAPAPGAAQAQGFAIPGAASTAPNVASDPTVAKLQRALTGAPEKYKASIQSRLDVAIKDAERRYNEGKAPEAVREWQWARQNGMTTTKSPTAYAAELAAAKRDPDTDVTNLRKEVQQLPSYKNISQAAPIYRSMFETAGRNTKASDLNLVYGLGKIMDPTSVVREGEMIMVKNSAGMSEQLMGAINALNGGAALTPETRQALMAEAYSRMNTYKGQFDQDMKQYRGIVGRRGFNADDVIPDPGEFSPYEGAPKAPGKGQPAPAASPAPVRPVESQYVRPDGSSPPTPSAPAAPAGPRRGELIDGYRFKGGDAGKPENWVKVK